MESVTHPCPRMKTPQEKKKASYEKDHYTFAWNSPHGFRKTWKKKKQNVNRVLRRKSKALLPSVEGLSCSELSPEQESFNDRLFRKGLSGKRLRKTGVVKLRQKVEQKIEDRRNHAAFNLRKRVQQIESFRRFCRNLLQGKTYSEEKMLQVDRLAQFPDFQEFLQSEPAWVPRLEQRILSASKRIPWEKKKQEQRFSPRRPHSTRA